MPFDISIGDAILLAGTLASFAVPLLRPVAEHLKALLEARLPATQAAVVEDIVSTVVHGVEQAAGAGVDGEDKRIEALRLINSMLAKRGIKADPNHVEMALQQAVFFMNQAKDVAASVEKAPVGFQAPAAE